MEINSINEKRLRWIKIQKPKKIDIFAYQDRNQIDLTKQVICLKIFISTSLK